MSDAQLVHQIGGRVLGDEVGDQALVPRSVLAREHHDLTDRRVPRDARFDLAELDAEAADLDLLVDAAEVLERRRFASAGRDRRCGTCARSGRRRTDRRRKRCAVSSGRFR